MCVMNTLGAQGVKDGQNSWGCRERFEGQGELGEHLQRMRQRGSGGRSWGIEGSQGAQAGVPDGEFLSLCVSGPGLGSDTAKAAARLATQGLRRRKRHRERLEREGNKGRLRVSGSFISFLLSLTSSLQSLDAPKSHTDC